MFSKPQVRVGSRRSQFLVAGWSVVKKRNWADGFLQETEAKQAHNLDFQEGKIKAIVSRSRDANAERLSRTAWGSRAQQEDVHWAL